MRHYYANTSDVTVQRDGSRAYRTHGPFASLAKVENCRCEDGRRRTAYVTAEPDTFFSIPACVSVSVRGAHSKTVSGFLTSDDDGYRFIAYAYGKNGHLLKKKEEPS